MEFKTDCPKMTGDQGWVHGGIAGEVGCMEVLAEKSLQVNIRYEVI